MTVPDTDTATAPATTGAVPRRGGAGRRLLRKPLGVFALVALTVIILLGLLEPLLNDYDPGLADLQQVNAGVGAPGHWLGTDQFGRDIWARILSSIEVSVVSALIGAGVAAVLGTVLGLIAGYIGKRTGAVLSWVFELLMTFPALILVIVLNPVTGGSYQIMMMIFGVFLSTGVFRLVRNLVVGVRNELYVDAARVSGLSNRRILSRHVLYIVRGPIIITSAFLASAAIGVQAGLAFLGIGSSQQVSFGSMTSDAFANVYVEPVQMVWPALVLGLMTGSLVLLGNAYRDALAAPTGSPGARKRARRRPPAASPIAAGEVVPADAAPGDAPADTGLDPASVQPTPATSGTSRVVPAPAEGALLAVRNLRVGYPQVDESVRDVVKGVSLEVSAGEIVGLVGESGSGKTTVAQLLFGLVPPTAGTVTFAGAPWSGVAERRRRPLRRRLQLISQDPLSAFDPRWTVGRIVAEALPRGAAVLPLLQRVGLGADVLDRHPRRLSGGQRQRVAIARALAPRPSLIICDEPVSALDVSVQAQVLDLLADIRATDGTALLFISHDLGVVRHLADRVLVMRDGAVVESGPVDDVFGRPRHDHTRALLDAVPTLEVSQT